MAGRAISTQSRNLTDLLGKNICFLCKNTYFLLLRLFPDGRVLFSQRMTLKAGCLMDLRKYPMDDQHCPLVIGSCEYFLTLDQ